MKFMMRGWVKRFVRDRRANAAVIFALATIPSIYLLGMATDYTQALRKKNQLDAAADAAVIAAVRPAMLLQTDAAAQSAATAVFASTANNVPGLTGAPSPTITIVDSGLQRTVTVSYSARSIITFGNVLGSTAWPINGTSTARAASAPNMNFYLVLDDSPSMAIGATQTDINNLDILHRQPAIRLEELRASPAMKRIPTSDSGANSSSVDNLTVARNKGVTLRIDLVINAVNQLLVSWPNCPQAGVSGGVAAMHVGPEQHQLQGGPPLSATPDYNFNTLQWPTSPSNRGQRHLEHPAHDGRPSELRHLRQPHHRLRHRHRERAHQRQQHHAQPGPWQQSDGRHAAGGRIPRDRRRRRQRSSR